MFQNGQSTGAERLTRIEGKLDHLITLAQEAGAGEHREPEAFADTMQRRLKEIIADIDVH